MQIHATISTMDDAPYVYMAYMDGERLAIFDSGSLYNVRDNESMGFYRRRQDATKALWPTSGDKA